MYQHDPHWTDFHHFYENLPRQPMFCYNQAQISDTVHEDIITFPYRQRH